MSRAPYEPPLTEKVAARLYLRRLRYPQLVRRSEAFNEFFLIERLAQETDRSVVERTRPVFLVRISGNQNDRRLVSLRTAMLPAIQVRSSLAFASL